MPTSDLRELLELLREYGVMKYSAGDLSLELAGSFKVLNTSTGATHEAQPKPAPVDPAAQELYSRLPDYLQRSFKIGDA